MKTRRLLTVSLVFAGLILALGGNLPAQVGPQMQPSALPLNFQSKELMEEIEIRNADAVLSPHGATPDIDFEALKENRYLPRSRSEITSLLNSSKLSKFTIDQILTSLVYQTKRIYGDDDRVDLMDFRLALAAAAPSVQSAQEPVFENARSVACLVPRRNAVETQDAYIFYLEKYGYKYSLCEDETFANQPILSESSGFKVADDILVTAGHCIDESSMDDLLVVFGFEKTSNPFGETLSVPKENVFKPVKILNWILEDPRKQPRGRDWAVVQLDRPMAGRPSVVFSDTDLKIGDSIYALGFPCGLPLKASLSARVLQNQPADSEGFYLKTNLDTYGGNSGSPVFDAASHKLVGMLVRGGEDFEKVYTVAGLCRRSVYVPGIPGKKDGEDVVTASKFRAFIP